MLSKSLNNTLVMIMFLIKISPFLPTVTFALMAPVVIYSVFVLNKIKYEGFKENTGD